MEFKDRASDVCPRRVYKDAAQVSEAFYITTFGVDDDPNTKRIMNKIAEHGLPCQCCGKNAIGSHYDALGVELCDACYDEAGDENFCSDNCEDVHILAHPGLPQMSYRRHHADCPIGLADADGKPRG